MFNYWEAKFYIIMCWVLFIFILIATPFTEASADSFTVYDKVVHFFMFGILAFLLNWGTKYRKKKKGVLTDVIVMLAVISYALATEYIQSFIPTREPALWDFISGMVGGVIGILFANTYLSKPK